jgi:hypothetical protein
MGTGMMSRQWMKDKKTTNGSSSTRVDGGL